MNARQVGALALDSTRKQRVQTSIAPVANAVDQPHLDFGTGSVAAAIATAAASSTSFSIGLRGTDAMSQSSTKHQHHQRRQHHQDRQLKRSLAPSHDHPSPSCWFGDDPCRSQRSNTTKCHRPDHRPDHKPPSKRRTQDIEQLRKELSRLQQIYEQLEQRNEQENQSASSWKLLARHEAALRQEALQENEKLKQTLAESRRMLQVLAKGVDKTRSVLHSLGSVEELEWKLGVLSTHPERRRFNADRIMNQLFNELPSKLLMCGLAQVTKPTRYTRVDNADLLDQTVHQEVNALQHLQGSYLALADVFWTCFTYEVIPFRDGVFFENAVIEYLDENTVLRSARTLLGDPRASKKSVEICPVRYMLMRRIVDDGCVTFASRRVEQVHDPFSIGMADDFCSWFSIHDGGLDDNGEPVAIFKCSLSAEMRPLSHRLEKMLAIAQQLKLGSLPDLLQLDYCGRRELEKQIRLVFMDYTMNTLWSTATIREAGFRKQIEGFRRVKGTHEENNTSGAHMQTSKPGLVMQVAPPRHVKATPPPKRLPPLREHLVRAHERKPSKVEVKNSHNELVNQDQPSSFLHFGNHG